MAGVRCSYQLLAVSGSGRASSLTVEAGARDERRSREGSSEGVVVVVVVAVQGDGGGGVVVVGWTTAEAAGTQPPTLSQNCICALAPRVFLLTINRDCSYRKQPGNLISSLVKTFTGISSSFKLMYGLPFLSFFSFFLERVCMCVCVCLCVWKAAKQHTALQNSDPPSTFTPTPTSSPSPSLLFLPLLSHLPITCRWKHFSYINTNKSKRNKLK